MNPMKSRHRCSEQMERAAAGRADFSRADRFMADVAGPVGIAPGELLCSDPMAAVDGLPAPSVSCADATWRLLRPSACQPALPPPLRLYHGVNVSTDEPHVVLGSPTNAKLRVFLPGTGSNPLQYSCLLRAVAQSSPVIGLSYAFVPASDSARNALCAAHYAAANHVATCLENSHTDALFGGHREPNLWPATSADDSISGRLVLLLRALAVQSPTDGWEAFLSADGRTPNWSQLWVGGHSQGGGHAAYLAATVGLAGATLLSAPQDECIGCVASQRIWLDDAPWVTNATVSALAHRNESAAALILRNWRRAAGGISTWAARDGEPSAIGMGLLRAAGDAPHIPFPWTTRVDPASRTRCRGRPFHCSTAKDSTTPVAATAGTDALALYEVRVWPALWGAGAGAAEGMIGAAPASPPPIICAGMQIPGGVCADTTIILVASALVCALLCSALGLFVLCCCCCRSGASGGPPRGQAQGLTPPLARTSTLPVEVSTVSVVPDVARVY